MAAASALGGLACGGTWQPSKAAQLASVAAAARARSKLIFIVMSSAADGGASS
jgi:hypothetical protein